MFLSQQAADAVRLEGVWFSYDGATVLEDVSFSIASRELVCIVGPNGGGKTTLLKLMLGLLCPVAGEVRLLGQPPRRTRHRVGYMPQHVRHDPLFPLTALDVVLMGRLGRKGMGGLLGWYTRADYRAARSALQAMDVAALADRPFAALSGGERQRVLIARALCIEPDILLLDEPTANVDTVFEARLLDTLRRLNDRLGVVVVSHDLGFVSHLVEKVICVNRRVTVHPTSQLTPSVFQELYGSEVHRIVTVRTPGSNEGASC